MLSLSSSGSTPLNRSCLALRSRAARAVDFRVGGRGFPRLGVRRLLSTGLGYCDVGLRCETVSFALGLGAGFKL